MSLGLPFGRAAAAGGVLNCGGMKNPWVIIGAAVAVLIGGSVWYASYVSERNNEGVVLAPHIKGNPDGRVVLVEYSDFQCPACAQAAPIIADILDVFGEYIRFEYRHFPLPIHALAEPAARAAEAAGVQGKFFEFHDKLFTNQREWSTSVNPNALFVRYAEEIGLDVDLFRRHLNSSLIRDRVRDSLREADELGLNATPTFFLNGERMQFQTYQEFFDQIARAVNQIYDANGGAGADAPAAEVRFGI
jgi:protein-disulfide isomerase